ncbi:MAG: hypothetical protein HQL58_05070 [Magnetococcales bacterium]|nr:hypothetical protein [Magnetococcales bacterium]
MAVIHQSDWIPLQDYHVKQIRKPKVQVQEAGFGLPPAPDLWVSWRDYSLHGQQPTRLRRSMAVAEQLRKQPPPTTSTSSSLPPEARVTVQQAVEQVFAPLARDKGYVHRRLDQVLSECRRRYSTGHFSEAQWRQCQQDMEQIRDQFARCGDEVAHWFLDHFFRIFEDIDELRAKARSKQKRRP